MSTSPTLDRLLTYARNRLVGALDPVILNELFGVIDEFCKETNAWQEKVPIRLRAGFVTYDDVESEDENARTLRLLRLEDENAVPVVGMMRTVGEVVLRDVPSQNATIYATISLTVKDPVTSLGIPDLPEEFFARHWQVFLDGVIGRMMAQPAKPYTNERTGIYHMRRFRNGMAMARVDSEHANVQRGQAWSFPKFA